AAAIDDPLEFDQFIQLHCGDNPELADKLRGMLTVREKPKQQAGKEQGGKAASASASGTRPLAPPAAQLGDTPPLGKVGKFRLEKLIGRGGMGNVYLAFDEQLRRPVALKFPRLGTLDNPQLLTQFLQEARLAAQLDHPNLVKIYQVDVLGDICFIASEWCEGGDLARWLVKHPGAQEPRWSAALIAALARAVAYCHQQNVAHLDIKPGNVILAISKQTIPMEESGDREREPLLDMRPMLTDFGVARVIEEGLTKTHSSLLMGTPLYMAPEQAECAREKIGPTSDIFALGVVLYELLYGRRPFDGPSPMLVMDQLRRADSLVLSKSREVPSELRTVCERCLQLAPEDRYPSADSLADDLERYLRHEPIHARPVSRVQRIWRWLEKPQRLVHVGMLAVVIQTIFLLNLVGTVTLKALGSATSMDADTGTIALPFAALALGLHVPSLVLALYTVRCRPWSVPLQLLQSLICTAMIGHILVTGESFVAFYRNQPLALFLVHFYLFIISSLQLLAYVAAIPAALRLQRVARESPRTSASAGTNTPL
ncbi:MAG: serine/threonine protein kinase, partial [Planctomycetales bacterium]|nr:serine/threonine protein kinase [Planctomycetales bacterium]